MSDSVSSLRAEVDDLRQQIAAAKADQAQREAAATDEYRAARLTRERDALREELKSLGLVADAPAPAPVETPAPAPVEPEPAPADPAVQTDTNPTSARR